MKTSIGKWGNSLALRLPKNVVEEAGLSEGTAVDIRTEDGEVIIAPTQRRRKLDDLLARFQPAHRRDETDWGEPVGEERW